MSITSPLCEIEDMIVNIQPLYNRLNSLFSKSYLSGSVWYVGDDLMKWWKGCNNIRYYSENVSQLILIIKVIRIHCEEEHKILGNN